jgi:hypothetical protein
MHDRLGCGDGVREGANHAPATIREITMHKLITTAVVLAGLAAAPATASAIGTEQGAYGCANGQSGPATGVYVAQAAAMTGQTVCLFALKNIDGSTVLNVVGPVMGFLPESVNFDRAGDGTFAESVWVGFPGGAIQPGPHTWSVRVVYGGLTYVASASMTTIADDPNVTSLHDPSLPAGATPATNEQMIAAGLMPASVPTGTAVSAETAAVIASLLEVAPAIFAATPQPVAAASAAGWCITVCAA